MDFKTLNQFKSLKKIKINDGEASSLLEAGMFELLLNKFPKGIKFTINGVSNNLQSFPADFKVLNFSFNNNKDANVILDKVNPVIQSELKDIFGNIKTLTINLKDFYETEYGSKPWKFKRNKIHSKILDQKFETLTFSLGFAFIRLDTHSQTQSNKKVEFFLNINKQQENIKNLVFDFSKDEYYKEDDYESNQFIFFTKFIYELIKQEPNIKIYLFHSELKEYNVRTFCVSPGPIKTSMGHDIVKNENPDERFDSFMNPNEIAEFIAYLISFDNEMVSEEIRLSRID